MTHSVHGPTAQDTPGRDTRTRPSGRRVRTYIAIAACAAVVIGVALAITVSKLSKSGYPIRSTQHVSYLGVYEPDAPGSYTGIDKFARSIGRQPDLVSYYSSWGVPFNAGFASAATRHGAVTLVQMDPKNVSLASIAAGQSDQYLRSYAAGVKSFRGQLVLSFGHEMNGSWYSWGYQHTSAKVFVAAWRHIVTTFRAVGANNVDWLWTVNVVNKSIPIPSPAPWWPGSSYVNWVGVDGYYYLPSSSFAQIFGPTIVDVRALTGDPILIAETGATHAAGQPSKISDLFAGIRAYGLIGFVWFDKNDAGQAWRITSPHAFAALRQGARAYVRPPADLAHALPSSRGPSS